MTWTLFKSLSGAVSQGRFLAWGGSMYYYVPSTTKIYRLTTGGTETEIGDVAADMAANVGHSLFVFNDELYMSVLDEITATPTYERRLFKYDGTPNNWTEQYNPPSEDTDTEAAAFMTVTENGTTIVANWGRLVDGAGNEHGGVSSNGTAFTNTAITGVLRGVVTVYPVTVENVVYIPITWNATSGKRWAKYDGSWTTSANDLGSYTYINYHVWGGGTANSFSGIWMKRTSDNALLRSTDDGDTFATTDTDMAATMTIGGGSAALVTANGSDEFTVSSVGGSDQLWRFNGSEWVVVDPTALPQAMANFAGIANVNGALYLVMGSSVYTTDQFAFASTSNTGVKVLATQPFRETSSYVASTLWNGLVPTPRLELHINELDSGRLVGVVNLGDCTYSDLIGGTYSAYVRPQALSDLYVFGRMNAPAGLSGVQHIIKVNATPGGVSAQSVKSDWGTDICSDLFASFLLGSSRTFFALREDRAGTTKLYGGSNVNSIAEISTVPVTNQTDYGSLAVNLSKRRIAVAANVAGSIMVQEAQAPYTAWTNITEDHPVAIINTIRYIDELS